MSQRHRFQKLLQHPGIRRGRVDSGCSRRRLPTGFEALDRALSGGWPAGSLIELLVDDCGVGEFRLLLPALATLGAGRRDEPGQWIMLVAPPHIPYAPALERRGMDLSRLLLVHCRREADIPWAAEQALRSGACAAVLIWAHLPDQRILRRLQLAAEEGSCWLVLFRPSRFRRRHSPAVLRAELRPLSADGIRMDIFKNQGGRPCSVIVPV